ncbi:MAG: hypothetical protein WDM96_00125 [Lacunisphaera sp.]
MEQSLDRCIALAPVGSALIWKGWVVAWQHGDLPGFRSWLDRIPGNFRVNDRTVYMSYVYACLSGDTAFGFKAVNGLAGTWLRDFYYIGPRALLLATCMAATENPTSPANNTNRPWRKSPAGRWPIPGIIPPARRRFGPSSAWAGWRRQRS